MVTTLFQPSAKTLQGAAQTILDRLRPYMAGLEAVVLTAEGDHRYVVFDFNLDIENLLMVRSPDRPAWDLVLPNSGVAIMTAPTLGLLVEKITPTALAYAYCLHFDPEAVTAQAFARIIAA